MNPTGNESGRTRKSLLQRFYGGGVYPLVVFALVLTGHTLGQDLIFFALLLITMVPGFLCATDLRFAVAPFLMTLLLVPAEHSPNVPYYSDYYLQPIPFCFLIICFSVLVGGILLFCILHRKEARTPHFFRGMLGGLVVLCAVLCCNGLLNPAYTVKNLLYALSFLPALLGVYLLFFAFLKPGTATAQYILYCLVLTGTLITCQLAIAFFRAGGLSGGVVSKESMILGWAVWTTAGGMQAFLMPACFYFAANHREGWFFYVLGLLQFCGTILSQSRGAVLVGAVMLVLCLAVLLFFGKNRRMNRWLTLTVAIVALAGVILFREQLFAVIEKIFSKGFDDNGRYTLWRTAWEHFLHNPAFGAGFYDSGIEQEWVINVYPYFYHNTLLQMLGSAGLAGVAAYLWHRGQTVCAVVMRPSLQKTFLGFCLLSMIGFCMLDVLFFITYPMIFYALILVALEKANP